MKILRNSLILLAVAASTVAMAQDSDSSLVFVDAAGNIIPDGTEITVKGLTDDGFLDPYIESGIFVSNTTDGRVGTSMSVTVTRIDSGQLDCCFPSTCQSFTTTESRETVKGSFDVGTKTMNTEWYPTSYGTCTAICQLEVYAVNGLAVGDKIGDGPTITINFVYDETSAGISDLAAEASPVVGYYTIDGRQLSAPQTGLTVIKYADGTSIKTICK